MTVGEMSSTSLDNCVRYANPAEKELKMVFSFHHLKVDYKDGQKWALKAPDYAELRSLFKTWQEGMPAQSCQPFRRRQELLERIRQVPCHADPSDAGHALHLSG